MSLVVTVGKDAKLSVHASTTSTAACLGVQNVSLDADWENKKVMHLCDSAKTTIMLLKNWTLSGTLTEDFADSTGQDVIRAAYNNGTNIAFTLFMKGGTGATASADAYSCTTGYVTKYASKADPMSENTATFTIESAGVAVTPPA